MALVAHDAGAACVDLYEAALLQRTDAGETPWPFNQTVDALPAGEVRAVPAGGVKPQAYLSGVQADAACRASGKRLCTVTEWMAACQGPAGNLYPYGSTYQKGWCNEGRATNPVIDLFGPNATFDSTEMNDPRLDELPNTVASGGAFDRCRSEVGAFDMHGNLHEWIEATTPSGRGIFKGGFFVDAKLNGPGCSYATTAHAKSYHDYSTGFRCCADPR
jgi:hypothetical protein